MCNYEGFLAIIKNKEKPELFLNVSENMTFCDNISVSPKGNLIFLQPNIKKNNSIKRPILIIDTEKSAFAYFDTNNVNCCYKIIQIHESVYKVEADAYQKKSDKRLRALSRKKIRINRLKWRNLTEFHS